MQGRRSLGSRRLKGSGFGLYHFGKRYRCAISRLRLQRASRRQSACKPARTDWLPGPGDLDSIGFGKGGEVLGGYRLSNAQRVNPGDSGRGGAEVRVKALGLWQQGVILLN